MDFSSLSGFGLLFLVQLVRSGHALQCYTCIPVIQTGVDCGAVTNDQVQPCGFGQDVCMATAVSVPGANGIRIPRINRGCAKSSDYAGSIGGIFQSNTQNCFSQTTSTTEGSQVSKICLCGTGDRCNSYSTADLSGSGVRVYGYTGSVSPLATSKLTLGLSAITLLLLCGIMG